MKHEVIDNSIDKEGHLSAFLPWGYGGGGAQTQFCISTLT